MAVTFTGAGTAVAASGATQNVTVTNTLSIGDYLVVLMAYDNSGGGGADPMSGTIGVGPTGLGASASSQTGHNDPGAASAGLAARCEVFPVTSTIPATATLTVSWTGTVVVRAVALMKVSSNAGGTVAYRTRHGATGSITGNVNVANAAGLVTPSVNSGEGVLCWACEENGIALTGDADTTNGTWGSIYGAFTGSGVAGMAAYMQGKVVTATATQTFNPTGNATLSDWLTGALIFTETLPPAITQSAYRFYEQGGEASSVAMAAENTAITGDLGQGDGYGQLRVRLQSTSAVAVPAADFQLQYAKNGGAWTNVSTDPKLLTTYPFSQYTSWVAVPNASGQSFTGNGEKLSRMGFDIHKFGAPPGTYTAALYAHSGTFGTSSIATGAALATSTTSILGTNLVTGFGWVFFDFDESFTLVNGTNYVMALVRGTAGDGSNLVEIVYDSVAPTRPGNACTFNGSTWTAVGGTDYMTQVYTKPTTPPTTVVGDFSYAMYGSTTAIVEEAPTTQRLTAGTGSFTAAGNMTGVGVCEGVGWTANNYIELLYALRLKAADLANGDALTFRVLKDGATAHMTYTATPTINIVNLSQTWTGGSTGTVGVAGVSGEFVYVPPIPPPVIGKYLDPSIGTASTPDPGVPPDPCIFVFAVTGPTASGNAALAAQMLVYPSGGSDNSWALRRFNNTGTGNLNLTVSADGGDNGAQLNGYPTFTDTANFQWIAMSWRQTPTYKLITWNSTNGTDWVEGVSDDVGSPWSPWNSSLPLTIGKAASTSSVWDGRIYFCELRTGLDPAAGAVLWRFNANDHVSGTTWVDETGKTWTVTNASAIKVPVVPQTWTGGSTATVGMAGVSGSFVSAVTWAGSTATIGVVGISGTMSQPWAIADLNLAARWDATVTASITGVNVTTQVESWNDLSGAGHHLVPVNLSNTSRLQTIHGMPMVALTPFNTDSTHLQVAGWTRNTVETIIGVVWRNGTLFQGGAGYDTVWWNQISAGDRSSIATTQPTIGDTATRTDWFSGWTTSWIRWVGGPPADSLLHLVAACSDGVSSWFDIDGIRVTGTNSAVAPVGFRVGGAGWNGWPNVAGMAVGELLVVNGTLTPQELADTYDYLRTKWSISDLFWYGSKGTAGVTGISGEFFTPTPQTWTGSPATAGVAGTSGAFTAAPITWTGGSTATAGAAGVSGSFVGGAVVWTGGSTGTAGVAGLTGTFTAGAVAWSGSTATAGVAGTSGEFFQPAPQTWVGSTATAGVAGVTGSFQSIVAWVGSTATAGVAAVSGAFVPGTATWVGSTATVGATGSSGAFIGGSTTWTGGSTATAGVAGVTGLFVAAPVTWTGSTATIGAAGISGVFTAGGQAWAGGSVATIGVIGISGALVPGATTWAGSTATAGVKGTSGTFTPGTTTWVGSTATVGAAGQSGVFSSGIVWAGSAATAGVKGISGLFVGGAVAWAGSEAEIGAAGTSGTWTSHITWVGSIATIGVTGESGTIFTAQIWVGSIAEIGVSGESGLWVEVMGIWVGSIALLSIAGQTGEWVSWFPTPKPRPRPRQPRNRYATPAKLYRQAHPRNYVIHMSTYVPEPNPYTDRAWAKREAIRKRAGRTSEPAGKTAEEIGRMGQDIDWRWLGTKGD